MKYYTKKENKYKKLRFFLIFVSILLVFILLIYFFDKRVFPSVLKVAEVKVKAEATELINKTSLELIREEFNYEKMIIIEKDSENNISLIRANTNELNYLSSELSIRCNEKLQEMEAVGVEVPLGWMSNNSTFFHLGPDITVDIEPIGSLDVSYESVFESAGINQTRHKIYLKINAKLKVKVPGNSDEVEVKCEVPVTETIIVGRIPNTAIDLGNR